MNMMHLMSVKLWVLCALLLPLLCTHISRHVHSLTHRSCLKYSLICYTHHYKNSRRCSPFGSQNFYVWLPHKLTWSPCEITAQWSKAFVNKTSSATLAFCDDYPFMSDSIKPEFCASLWNFKKFEQRPKFFAFLHVNWSWYELALKKCNLFIN